MKVEVSLAKDISVSLGITAAASAIDAGIQKKIHGSRTTTSIVLNKKLNGIMEIVQALENSNVFWKKLLKQLKTKKNSKNEDFWECYVVRYFRS